MELESTAQRMARLNKNVLLLSKIDNDQFAETEDLELSSIINDQLSGLAQLENINIVTSTDMFSLRANRTLIEILLTNLFHNAVRYSARNTVITIMLKNRLLTVSNKGTPLKMEVTKMTERFSKGNSDPASTGLGLAIVKKICDSCGYKLGYSYTDGVHFFTVNFLT
jgi:signal transduction histidine kinase